MKMAIEFLKMEINGLLFKSYWMPGKVLSRDALESLIGDIDKVNQSMGTLDYGFFAPGINFEERLEILKNTNWCVIYKNDRPCGFVYQYYIGRTDEGKMIIHVGLIKLNMLPGPTHIELPYYPLTFGNLINYGPHIITSISHVPLIIGTVQNFTRDLFPSYRTQDMALRKKYLPVLDRLTKVYLENILGYDPKSVCKRSFRIKGAMKNPSKGFNNDWETVAKSPEMACNLFVKEWMDVSEGDDGKLKIKDDLIQIGQTDFLCIDNILNCFNESKILEVNGSLAQDCPETSQRSARESISVS
jgi:hypothetical protein